MATPNAGRGVLARLSPRAKEFLRSAYAVVVGAPGIRHTMTRVQLRRRAGRDHRLLELGPGPTRIDGFETLNVVPGPNVDYIADATRRLPFPDNTFELIYASHILEHVPWYQTEATLLEWVRVIESGGALEVWVPNGLKIAEVFVNAETLGVDETHLDGWYRFNAERDPCRWAAGRLFTYGDGTGRINHPNWHRALFSPRYLREQLEGAGLVDIVEMERSQVRGDDHGWINLGMKGYKP